MADPELLLNVYRDNTNTVNTLWGIYYAIALGVLGFVYKEENLRNNWMALMLFSVGFAIFTYGNHTAMMRSQNVIISVNEAFHDNALLATIPDKRLAAILRAHAAATAKGIWLTHLILSVLVIGALWVPLAMQWWQRRA